MAKRHIHRLPIPNQQPMKRMKRIRAVVGRSMSATMAITIVIYPFALPMTMTTIPIASYCSRTLGLSYLLFAPVLGGFYFRLIWVHYSGLRIPGLVNALSAFLLDERWAEEVFARPGKLSSLVKGNADQFRTTQDSYAGAIIGREKRYRDSFDMVRQWGYDTRNPLESITLRGVGRQWGDFDGDEELVRCIF